MPLSLAMEVVRFYRPLGFFGKWPKKDDEAVANEVLRLAAKQWFLDDVDETWGRELMLLQMDEDRVWCQDTETDEGTGQPNYKKVVKEFARISRGALDAGGVKVNWEEGEGPHISFKVGGKKHEAQLEDIGDFVDLGILADFNKAMEGSGMAFCEITMKGSGSDAFIAVLTPAERAKIQAERGFSIRATGESNGPK